MEKYRSITAAYYKGAHGVIVSHCCMVLQAPVTMRRLLLCVPERLCHMGTWQRAMQHNPAEAPAKLGHAAC